MEILKNTNFDFMKYRVHAIILSLVIIGSGVVSLIVKGGPNYGVDFAGGTFIDVCIKKPQVDVGQIREALKEVIPVDSTIQTAGKDLSGKDQTCQGGTEALIRTPMEAQKEKSEEEIEREVEKTSNLVEAKLKETFGEIEVIRKEMVGPKVGRELRSSAMLSIVLALAGILIYVSLRFRFFYALGGVIALVHDVAVTIGLFSLTNRQIDLTVVGALLTIVGFSLNDTIVIFDRVRENLTYRQYREMPFMQLINFTLNQTLSRTILTSFTVFMVVCCLFFFGGPVINDFAFALLVGTFTGTYSTVFIASALVVWYYGPASTAASRKEKIARI